MSKPIERFSYGEPNFDYLATWLERDDDGPFWALNLMKYRDVAIDADGREQERSGLEADNEYAPVAQIEAVGGRLVLVAPVELQLRGDATGWDRVAVVWYPTRMSFIEMSMREDFQAQHEHKNAGMETTIVVASMPRAGEPSPTPVSSPASRRDRLLLQVVTDPSAPDLTGSIEADRIGRFEVEGNIFGDERRWAEARWDRITPEAAAELSASEPVSDENAYVMICRPQLDTLAESVLTSPV